MRICAGVSSCSAAAMQKSKGFGKDVGQQQ